MRTVRRKHGWHRPRGIGAWPVWQLSGWLLAFIVAVISADIAAIVAAAVTTPLRAADLEVAAVLLACSLATVELTRRVGEPGGVAKDVYAIWELPLALLLPPLYGLLVPIPRLILIQLRVRSTVVYRRVFTAAALGLSYAAASLAFHASAPPVSWAAPAPRDRVVEWAAAALACGLLKWAVNQLLVMTAVKGADRSISVRRELFARDMAFNQAAELSVGVLLAYAVTGSPLMALIALPLVTVLHRSFRHAQLVDASRIDGKTGLLNATAWQREASLQVSRAAAAQSPLAVAIADIDHFKVINDTFGHLAGDLVLAGLAGALTGSLRGGDLVGRFGGEEFVVLLPRTSPDEARQIAERLCEAVAQLVTPAGDSPGSAALRVTISIGVAVMESSPRDLNELLAAADVALYAAKNAGRNRVRMLSETPVQLRDPGRELPGS